MLRGGDGDDGLVGDHGADTVVGGAGNDRIEAAGGLDGSDLLMGEDGNDVLALTPGRGVPTFDGGTGVDAVELLLGGADARPPARSVVISSRDGVIPVDGTRVLALRDVEGMVVRTGDGDDVVTSDLLGDRIWTGGGADRIDAGAGNDAVHAGTGANVVMAGDGDDLVSHVLASSNTLDGGAGFDTPVMRLPTSLDVLVDGSRAITDRVTVSLTSDSLGSTFAGFERLVISAHAGGVTATMGDGADVFTGNAGADVVHAGGGDWDEVLIHVGWSGIDWGNMISPLPGLRLAAPGPS